MGQKFAKFDRFSEKLAMKIDLPEGLIWAVSHFLKVFDVSREAKIPKTRNELPTPGMRSKGKWGRKEN